MRRFLIISSLILCGMSRAGTEEENIPPVLPPADAPQSKPDDGPVVPEPASAPVPAKVDCSEPQKETIAGRCVCDKPKPVIQYKTKIVEKPVIKYKTKTVDRPVVKYKTRVVETYVDRPVEKTVYVDRPVDRVVERTVDRVVEKSVPGTFKHHNVSLFYGRGPNGVDRVLYERRDGVKEYKFLVGDGDVGALQYTYRFTEAFNGSVMGITNETYMGGVGLSF